MQDLVKALNSVVTPIPLQEGNLKNTTETTCFSYSTLQIYLRNFKEVYLLYKVQQQLYQFTIPPCLAATRMLPEVDGSRNLFDPREKLAQDKCCLPWLVSHENQSSQIPLGMKKENVTVAGLNNPLFFFFQGSKYEWLNSSSHCEGRKEATKEGSQAKMWHKTFLYLICYLRMPNQTATLESMFQPL